MAIHYFARNYLWVAWPILGVVAVCEAVWSTACTWSRDYSFRRSSCSPQELQLQPSVESKPAYYIEIMSTRMSSVPKAQNIARLHRTNKANQKAWNVNWNIKPRRLLSQKFHIHLSCILPTNLCLILFPRVIFNKMQDCSSNFLKFFINQTYFAAEQSLPRRSSLILTYF